MSETKVDIPRLRKAVEWVEEQAALPVTIRQWLQTKWMVIRGHDSYHDNILENNQRTECGTAMCLAGKVVQDEYGRTWIKERLPNVSFRDEGAKLLGLTMVQADMLFDANNSATEIRAIAERIAGEKL